MFDGAGSLVVSIFGVRKPLGGVWARNLEPRRPSTLGMNDWLRKLDRGMNAITTRALEVTDDARKTLAIGVGELDVQFEGRTRLGDTLQGRVGVRVPEPLEVDRVVVTLRARQERVGVERNHHGRLDKVRRKHTLFEYEVELMGAGALDSRSFGFQIPTPSDLEASPGADVGGVLGDVLKFAGEVRAMTSKPVVWTLEVVVHRPWKRNLHKEVSAPVTS